MRICVGNMRHGFRKILNRSCDQPGQTETSSRIASDQVQMAQALTKSASILTISIRIRTSSEFISHKNQYEWFGRLHAGVGGDGEQAGLHV